MNVDPSVMTESTRVLRRYAAQAPSRVPMMNDRICVTPDQDDRPERRVCPITSVTV